MSKRLVVSDAVNLVRRAAIAVSALIVFASCLSGAAFAETRTLKLYNTHTKERVSITFKKNGRYLPKGLREANRFLRDWRRNEIIKMDPELLDLVWEVYRKVGAKDYIHVVSSYRSPATNNMLRKRSKGVAKNSQHTLGKAMDFYIPGVNLAKLRATGLRKQVGGVGYYPRSGSPFVHLDTGSVRHWPKMSRSQLAKVFPKGKTLHIPSDGKPLKGYKLALAEAKSGKRRSSKPTLVASSRQSESRPASTRNQELTNPSKTAAAPAREKPRSNRNLFASLFANDGANSNDNTRPGAVGNRVPPQAVPGTASAAIENAPIENPPVPARKVLSPAPEPVGTQVAEASPPPNPPDGTSVQLASATPPPAPNTLDAQRAALSAGQPNAASAPLDERFGVAALPGQKPTTDLTAAARQAAAQARAPIPSPASSTASDPVAAIAAATGTGIPSPSPAPRAGTTLAYASATATPPSLNRSLQPAPAAKSQAPASGQRPAQSAAAAKPSISGKIPRDQIVDPLAGFASLPDKSAPVLLSGNGTTRHQAFAWLSHPNQRQLKNVMKPGNRFVSASFENTPYDGLRTDRFDGPAIVVLPVRFAR